MDMVQALEQAVTDTGRLVAGVKPGQLKSSTPCAKFDVRALVNHMVGANFAFSEAAAGKKIEGAGENPPDLVGDDPAGAYERSAKTLLEAFRQPGILASTLELPPGPMPGEQALGIAITETLVHSWDLAKATGQQVTADPQVAETMLAGAKAMMSDQWRNEAGDPFGPEVTCKETAPAIDRLAAFLGRKQ